MNQLPDMATAVHGAAPHENRKEGANPLVSLANFLGDLVEQGVLARNDTGELCRFISWAWGTRVFGERQPDLLQRSDEVFVEGTTYALTRFQTRPEDAPGIGARLKVDIRYALGHHGVAWDGEHEGLVGGEGSTSRFPQLFSELLQRFPASAGLELAVTTQTVSPPDVRLPQSGSFSRVNSAYMKLERAPCQELAIGSMTDARGNLRLLAAGPLFADVYGPPINYHGFEEGAPVEDLKHSAFTLYRLLADHVEAAEGSPGASK